MVQVGGERRKAYRVPVTDLRVRVVGYGREFTARDLSVNGIGFLQEDSPFKLAQMLRLDLLDGDEAVVQGLAAIVARVGMGVVGCAFLKMDEAMQGSVEALILSKQEERQASGV